MHCWVMVEGVAEPQPLVMEINASSETDNKRYGLVPAHA